MSNYRTNTETLFMGDDLRRPRWTVEREKISKQFPGFSFYSRDGRVSSIQGYLSTNRGNDYYIKIIISSDYPYALPEIELLHHNIDPECPHQFSGNKICVMRSAQWSSSLSLAFLVAKAAIWLNKYDVWRYKGKVRWPGKGQSH